MKYINTQRSLVMLICLSSMLGLPRALAEPRPLGPVTQPADDDLKGVAFAISSANSSPKIGAPIALKIVLQNKTNRPLTFRDRRKGGDEINYLISVERVGGPDPALTELGLELYTPKDFERLTDFRKSLEPGSSVQVTLDLNRIYQIKEPGEYRVQVKRYVYRAKQDLLIPILSNKLTLKIGKD